MHTPEAVHASELQEVGGHEREEHGPSEPHEEPHEEPLEAEEQSHEE